MNFKKWFNKQKILTTINRDSFYIVLFLCLVILAITAVWVTRSNIKFFSQKDIFPDEINMQEDYYIEELPGEKEEQVISMNEGKKQEDQKEEAVKQEQEEIVQQQVEQEKKSGEQPKMQQTVAVTEPEKTTPKEEKMIRPVPGKIIMDFGKDTLVYSRTLEQWTTHYGIDIAADVGTPVKAVMSGKVTRICTDVKLGIMITIDHGNGLVTRYANLQNNNMVKEGQKVERGKVISGVGKTADFEIGDPPHLHFEVIKNGEHQDPKQYLPNM